MDLTKLFETQYKLDEKIKEEKGLQGHDLLDKKILALQVELGELANEWRGFKFWSEDREPRNKDIKCHACKGFGFFEIEHNYNIHNKIREGCGYCDETGIQENNPLLEEYVDCLHFILSIGNEATLHYCQPISRFLEYQTEIELSNVTDQFLHLFMEISGTIRLDTYIRIWNLFNGLGKMLGFTWEQIEQAYYGKNKINHERQVNGY